MTTSYEDAKERLLDAALVHVPFDGWSEICFRAAIADTGLDETLARAVCPRGAVDLALAFHRRGDAAMLERLKSEDLSDMKFRDRIAAVIDARPIATIGQPPRHTRNTPTAKAKLNTTTIAARICSGVTRPACVTRSGPVRASVSTPRS